MFKPVRLQGHLPNTSSQVGSPSPNVSIPGELEATGGHSRLSARLTRHYDKARTSRLVTVGEGIGEKPEEGWEMPWSLMHKHDRLSQALLLTPMKSHALVRWERQPRRLSTQQAAGPGNRSAWYTHTSASPGFIHG